MKYKQRALITKIDHLNENFEVKMADYPTEHFTLTIDGGADGNVQLPLLKEQFSAYFEIGDDIEFKKLAGSGFEIINLSCEVLRISRFKRDLTSMLRRLDNDNHSLKRCILLNESGFVLLAAKKNPEKINIITEVTQISEDNHERF